MSLTGDIDRRQYLQGLQTRWNGIDYVEVATPDQTTLRVHFINSVPLSGSLGATSGSPPADSAAGAVTITGGEVITSVAVLPIDETTDLSSDTEGRPVLTIRVAAPGDFSTYQLTVVSTALDPYFDSVPFSFKANCPSDFDCQQPTAPCPPPETLDVPIDYLAKDFDSFVQALSEFSTQRYPAWLERSEADLGMVVMEVLAAIGDELSYYQDRIANESLLPTATQPVSLLHLARLVDYEPAPATTATVLLQLDVDTAIPAITTRVHCQALAAGGGLIDFEVGEGVADPTTGEVATFSYPVSALWNRSNMQPYWWDESQRCLPAGATSFYLHNQGFGLTAGQQLLIDTAGLTSADPPIREVVVIGPTPTEVSDPVLNAPLTRVTLAAPTTLDHDLTRTSYAGNLVPATQGLSTTETFTIADDGFGGQPDSTPTALVRLGPNWTPQDPTPNYFYCLANGPLAWIAGSGTEADTAEPTRPEIVLSSQGGAWTWVRWLLDADPGDAAFTLTPELYSPVLTASRYQCSEQQMVRSTWFDYDGGNGTTIRFGDGTFGSLPTPGLTFQALYRVGGGVIGNVAADTINIVTADAVNAHVLSCTNPFPATGGTDAETPQQIRDGAPQAFAANPLRIVRPADYVAAAESQPWVQQAGTTFRWTGSWLTVFSAADPVATEQPTPAEVGMLTDLLNRRRLAGYESYVLPPSYVSVDLQVTLCANPAYFAADVEEAVLTALRPGQQPGGAVGFFDHTRWGFGSPLESSALLAAVQACTGVDGVTQVLFRQRGVQNSWTALPDTLAVAADQILRVDDDPSRPEAGSLKVIVNGGKA